MLALYLTLFNNMVTDTFSKTDMRLHILHVQSPGVSSYVLLWLQMARLHTSNPSTKMPLTKTPSWSTPLLHHIRTWYMSQFRDHFVLNMCALNSEPYSSFCYRLSNKEHLLMATELIPIIFFLYCIFFWLTFYFVFWNGQLSSLLLTKKNCTTTVVSVKMSSNMP